MTVMRERHVTCAVCNSCHCHVCIAREREVNRQAIKAGQAIIARVGAAADRLLDCLNEFAPDYPQACSDHSEALDIVLAEAESGQWLTRRGSP